MALGISVTPFLIKMHFLRDRSGPGCQNRRLPSSRTNLYLVLHSNAEKSTVAADIKAKITEALCKWVYISRLKHRHWVSFCSSRHEILVPLFTLNALRGKLFQYVFGTMFCEGFQGVGASFSPHHHGVSIEIKISFLNTDTHNKPI